MIFYTNSYYHFFFLYVYFLTKNILNEKRKMNRGEGGEGKIYQPLIFLYFLLRYEIQGGCISSVEPNSITPSATRIQHMVLSPY